VCSSDLGARPARPGARRCGASARRRPRRAACARSRAGRTGDARTFAGAARAGRDARAGVTMRSESVKAPSAPTTDGRVPTSMLAVVLTGPGVEGLTLQRVEVARPGRMELLCRVDAVYICGT